MFDKIVMTNETFNFFKCSTNLGKFKVTDYSSLLAANVFDSLVWKENDIDYFGFDYSNTWAARLCFR